MRKFVLTLISVFMMSSVYGHEVQWDHDELKASAKEALQQAAEEIDKIREELGQVPLMLPAETSIYIDALGDDQSFESIGPERAHLGLMLGTQNGRLVVFGYVPWSVNQDSGIEPGDTLIAIDGERLENESENMETLLSYLTTIEPGTEVSLTIERDGNTMVFPFDTQSNRPSDVASWLKDQDGLQAQEMMANPEFFHHLMELRQGALTQHGPEGFVAFGADMVTGPFQMTDLNEDLARYFNVDAGVLILKADPSSELKAGDVIIAVDGEEVTNRRELFMLSLKGEYATIQRENSTFDIEIPDAGLNHGRGFSRKIEVFSNDEHYKGNW